MLGESVKPLLKRLRLTAGVSEQDERAISQLPVRVKHIGAGETVSRTGDKPSVCCLVIDGFVQRSKGRSRKPSADSVISPARGYS